LDKELERYYNNRFDLCASVGWKELLEDLTEARNKYARIENINNVEDFWRNKGKVEILDYILNLKEISEKVYQEIKDDQKNI
jgi:hypothetical protein